MSLSVAQQGTIDFLLWLLMRDAMSFFLFDKMQMSKRRPLTLATPEESRVTSALTTFLKRVRSFLEDLMVVLVRK